MGGRLCGMPPRGRSSRSARGGRGGGAASSRPYERTVRVNESMREVLAEALEDLDDDRLNLVTITGVDVDPDFRHGVVFFSSTFSASDTEDVVEAFDEYRVRLQGEIGRQVRLKRTPQLTFRPDPAIDEGQKMDGLIKNLPLVQPDDAD
jgi:ribosome-binding factor A